MNEMIDIVEILKDCKKGTKLYSPLFGEVKFIKVVPKGTQCITVSAGNRTVYFTRGGKYYSCFDNDECLLFPSKDQRDWTKFKAEKERFDPHTFKPFDRMLVRCDTSDTWTIDFFSHLTTYEGRPVVALTGCILDYLCIPFNEETAHLVGTTDDCPDYYKWWRE